MNKFVEMGRTEKLMIASDANQFTPVVMLFEKIFSLLARRISITEKKLFLSLFSTFQVATSKEMANDQSKLILHSEHVCENEIKLRG